MTVKSGLFGKFHGHREELRSEAGRSQRTTKQPSTHFAALWLLLIIYAASVAPLPATPIRRGTARCTVQRGPVRTTPLCYHRLYIVVYLVYRSGTDETEPILSRATIDSPGIIIMIGFPAVLGAGLLAFFPFLPSLLCCLPFVALPSFRTV